MSIMPTRGLRERGAYAYVLLVAALVVLPFASLSFFTHPCIDDYWYAADVRHAGFWSTQVKWFMERNARYFTNGLMCLSPVVWEYFQGYKLASLLVFVLLGSGLYVACRHVLGCRRLNAAALALAVLALYLVYMPHPAEGFYWLPCATNYTLPLALLLYFAALLVRLRDELRRGIRIASFLGAACLVVCIAGCGETALVLLAGVLGAACAADIWRERKLKAWLVALLGLGAVCGGAVVLCPGTARRAMMYHPELRSSLLDTVTPGHVLYVVLQSVQLGAGCVAKWLTDFPCLPVLSILFLSSWRVGETTTGEGARHRIHPLAWVILWLGLVVASFVPYVWGLGKATTVEGIEPRIFNVAFFVFVAGMAGSLHAIVRYAWDRYGCVFPSLPRYAVVILLSLTFVELARYNNLRVACTDLLTGGARRYDRQMQERYEAIRRCKDPVCILPEVVRPRSFPVHDDVQPEGEPTNPSYAAYWGKSKIIRRE